MLLWYIYESLYYETVLTNLSRKFSNMHAWTDLYVWESTLLEKKKIECYSHFNVRMALDILISSILMHFTAKI